MSFKSSRKYPKILGYVALPLDVNAPRSSSIFKSFVQGGFECATHRRKDGTRIDVLAMSGHDRFCAEDYRLLASAGIKSIRDGLRWHLIETTPGEYDWSTFLPMLHSSFETETQVIWDFCHWGVPDDLNVFSPEFPFRFAAFAAAAASLIQTEKRKVSVEGPSIYCAINEISFWAWVGGDIEHFHPYGQNRGAELKRQLVRASLAAVRAVRAVDPSAKFIQAEPLIHISALEEGSEASVDAARHTASQFEAWDMLTGSLDPEIGGEPTAIDFIGVNYYWNNQWIHNGDRTPPGHALHRPLHDMLVEVWERYHRPILITETGTEFGAELGWIGYIMAEVRQAHRLGVPVLGVCLYPIMDYPGWDDDRHCPCGAIEISQDWTSRHLRTDLCAELRLAEEVLGRHQVSNLTSEDPLSPVPAS